MLPKEYTLLFNAITDAEKVLQDLQTKLMLAQQLSEELYISSGRSEIVPLNASSDSADQDVS